MTKGMIVKYEYFISYSVRNQASSQQDFMLDNTVLELKDHITSMEDLTKAQHLIRDTKYSNAVVKIINYELLRAIGEEE